MAKKWLRMAIFYPFLWPLRDTKGFVWEAKLGKVAS